MEQTPLFQLNLMLWLTWPTSRASTFDPIFRKDGYALFWLSPPIPATPDIRVRAARASMRLAERSHPDVMLRHDLNRVILPIECKLNGFGAVMLPDRDNREVAQGLNLLSTSGRRIADYYGLRNPDLWNAYLLYCVGDGQEARMHETISELRSQLQRAGITPMMGGALGIYVEDDGIYLQSAMGADIPVTALRTRPHLRVRVMHLEPDDDPRPLYLIPWDPSVDRLDDYERQVVQEKFRGALFSAIGRQLGKTSFDVALDDLLTVTVPVWRHWQDSAATRGFRSVVRSYASQLLRPLSQMGLTHQSTSKGFAFTVAPGAAIRIRRRLARHLGRGDAGSDHVQLDFGSLTSDW